jgi:hypothetical protein
MLFPALLTGEEMDDMSKAERVTARTAAQLLLPSDW